MRVGHLKLKMSVLPVRAAFMNIWRKGCAAGPFKRPVRLRCQRPAAPGTIRDDIKDREAGRQADCCMFVAFASLPEKSRLSILPEGQDE